MMRVATSLVIVALLTAAATAARMNRQQKGTDSCIATFMDLKDSLAKQNSNINRLHNAFSPSNQRVPVAVDLLVHFSTSLQTTSYKLYNLSTARLDNQTADHKFRWSASAMLLFIRPEMLRPLSLFVYQGIVTTAEVVIDPVCEKADSVDQQMEGKVCKGSTCINEEKSKRLLNKLCIHLKSYDNHKAAERAHTGYCQYYFNQTDLHILDNSTEDTLQKIFLIIAITFLWLIITISVPVALYTVIPIKMATTEPTLTTTAHKDEWKNWSTTLPHAVVQVLVKTRESSNMYYIIAVFTIAPFLDISIIGLNVWSLMNCKFALFVLHFHILFLVLSIFDVIYISAMTYRNKGKLDTQRARNISAMTYRNKGKLDMQRARNISAMTYHNKDELDTWKAHILYAAGIFSVVIALQLLIFHGTFILLVFIFSPIPTACFTLIYISALFSMWNAVSTVIKVIHRHHKGEIRGKKCHYAFQITAAILLAFCVLSFDALFFITLMRARLEYFGFSRIFGALVPTAIIAIISFTGNMLIANDDKKSNTGARNTLVANDDKKSNTGVRNPLVANDDVESNIGVRNPLVANDDVESNTGVRNPLVANDDVESNTGARHTVIVNADVESNNSENEGEGSNTGGCRAHGDIQEHA